MDSRLYNVIKTIHDGDYLYEVVESGGQRGVRCRIYISQDKLFDCLDKYDDTKYRYHFQKFMSKRYPLEKAYKFDAIVWCWPYDVFYIHIGQQMAKDRVDAKIKAKKTKIKRLLSKLEHNNMKHTKLNK